MCLSRPSPSRRPLSFLLTKQYWGLPPPLAVVGRPTRGGRKGRPYRRLPRLSDVRVHGVHAVDSFQCLGKQSHNSKSSAARRALEPSSSMSMIQVAFWGIIV
jgi:hypothetical protein